MGRLSPCVARLPFDRLATAASEAIALVRPSTAANLTGALLDRHLEAGRGAAPALRCEGETVSYRGLASRVAALGHAMRRAGVRPGDRVGLLMGDRPDLVAAWLAAVRVGGVGIVLSVRASAEEVRFVLDDAGVALLLVDPDLAPVAESALAGLGCAPAVVVADRAGLDRFAPGGEGPLAPAPVRPDDMAYWLYTSGTTGRPKAVMHAHRDVEIADRHLRENLGVGPGARIFTTSKLFFAYALGHSLLGGLKAGATVVLHPGWPDPASVAEVIERDRPTHVLSVPTLYRRLLAEGFARRPALGAVRCYVSAGEPLPAALFEQWRAATGVPVCEGIGASETTFLFIAGTPRAHRAGATGRPLPWAEVEIRDEAGRAVAAPGVPGVLWVRMRSLFLGYRGQPERTAAVCDGGWYRTDDVFSFDADGFWHYHGRADDMLKISGQWVSPVEVEQAALDLPGIADAAAVGVPDPDGLTRIVLFAVAARPGCGPAPGAIAAALRERLPHHRCPREVRLVAEIPRTATGKIRRFRLRESI